MDRDIVTRTIVETVAERCIREVEQDPDRSIRKLVDLGRQLTKGRFQQQFFALIQKMFAKEESPYYTLLRDMVSKADHDTIKTFGINVGFNGWTNGARTIRALEEQRGHSLPWAITLHIDATLDQAGLDLYQRIISRGKAEGAFIYLLRVDGPGADLEGIFTLVRREPCCAFLLFAPPEELTAERIAEISRCHNLVALVDTVRSGWEDAAGMLECARCLYGVFCTYADQTEAGKILSGAWAGGIPARYTPTFAICFSAPGCPKAVSNQVAAYARRARTEQYYSIFLIDYFSDHHYIDEIISSGHCFVGVRPDGSLTGFVDGAEQAVGRVPAEIAGERGAGD